MVNFNRRAIRWAAAHGKPLVGNTDLHLLEQMGSTFTLVEAAAEPEAIVDAIRAGRVELRTMPLSMFRAASMFSRMLGAGLIGRLQRSSG